PVQSQTATRLSPAEGLPKKLWKSRALTMKPDPPKWLSHSPESAACVGITDAQQSTPAVPAHVPSGVGSVPMFSIATLKLVLGPPLFSVTLRPCSIAFLSKANCCAPLKPPPPNPPPFSANSS